MADASSGYPAAAPLPVAPHEDPFAIHSVTVPEGNDRPLVEAPGTTAVVFALDDGEDGEELLPDSEAAPTGSAPSFCSTEAARKLSAGDWYTLDDADANERVEHTQQSDEAAKASAEVAQELEPLKSAPALPGRLGPLWSSLGRKGLNLLDEAKKVIVEEARLVAEETREFADGVREGVHLTAQDTKALGEKLAQNARAAQGWRGMLGARMRGLRPQASTEAESSAAASGESSAPSTLDVLRQGLAVTAEVSQNILRDLREVNQEVVNEVRQSVGDIRTALQDIAAVTAPSLSSQPGSKQDAQLIASEAETSDALPVASPTEALDAMIYGEGSNETNSEVNCDQRSTAERRYDEQAQKASERMKSMASLSKQVSENLWRKTEGLRDGLLQRGLRHGGLASEASHDVFWTLPSSCANYVQLCVEESAGSSSSKAAGAEAAVERVRRLGGSLAQKGLDVINKARDLNRNLAKAGTKPSPAPTAATEAFDGDSIFEIGSDGDAAWSDGEGPDAPGDLSDGATSDTRSSHSVPAGNCVATGATSGAEDPQSS